MHGVRGVHRGLHATSAGEADVRGRASIANTIVLHTDGDTLALRDLIITGVARPLDPQYRSISSWPPGWPMMAAVRTTLQPAGSPGEAVPYGTIRQSIQSKYYQGWFYR